MPRGCDGLNTPRDSDCHTRFVHSPYLESSRCFATKWLYGRLESSWVAALCKKIRETAITRSGHSHKCLFRLSLVQSALSLLRWNQVDQRADSLSQADVRAACTKPKKYTADPTMCISPPLLPGCATHDHFEYLGVGLS